MNINFYRFVALILFLAAPITSFSIELNGAGRRIPAPIFSLWSEHFSQLKPGITIKYQADFDNPQQLE